MSDWAKQLAEDERNREDLEKRARRAYESQHRNTFDEFGSAVVRALRTYNSTPDLPRQRRITMQKSGVHDLRLAVPGPSAIIEVRFDATNRVITVRDETTSVAAHFFVNMDVATGNLRVIEQSGEPVTAEVFAENAVRAVLQRLSPENP